MNAFILFFPESPTLWVVVLAAVFLLFGGAKLPQLAKALGQSKRAFKEGLEEAEHDEHEKERKEVQAGGSPLATVDDETLFEEARRRAAARNRSEP
jgi:TatA/E family protein of Tat protein translocase